MLYRQHQFLKYQRVWPIRTFSYSRFYVRNILQTGVLSHQQTFLLAARSLCSNNNNTLSCSARSDPMLGFVLCEEHKVGRDIICYAAAKLIKYLSVRLVQTLSCGRYSVMNIRQTLTLTLQQTFANWHAPSAAKINVNVLRDVL